MKYFNIIQAAVAEILGLEVSQIQVEYPPRIDFGEVAVPCFGLVPQAEINKVVLAVREANQGLEQKALEKLERKAKVDFVGAESKKIADSLPDKCKDHASLSGIVEQVTVDGAYVNFRLVDSVLLEVISDGLNAAGWKELLPPAKTMVEFFSPNTNKPAHLGHLRNLFLGDAVSRILTAGGQQVVKANLINDRGVHICKSMLAWKKWANGATPESTGIKGDHFVGDWYVRYAKELEKDPALEDEVRAMLVAWEAKDPEVLELWQTMNSWVFAGFEETLNRLGITFDKVYYESNTYLLGKDVVDKGLAAGVFTAQADGSVVYMLPAEEFGLSKDKEPKFVLLRRPDGTSVYITQDIGTAIMKADDFGLDRSIYLVGSEQNYHFQCLFSILKSLGYSWADGLFHLSYGMVKLPSGKMKSREGTVVDADDLIEEMVERAKEVIREKHQDLPESEVAERAEMIGLGAMKFFLLFVPPANGMNYDPAASISFEGKTGPYCQYAAVRARNIIEKAAGMNLQPNLSGALAGVTQLGLPERALAVQLMKLPVQIRASALELNPSILASHIHAIAQAFNSFYNSTPVLKDEPVSATEIGLVQIRLGLVRLCQQAIENGLGLLGIQTPKKM